MRAVLTLIGLAALSLSAFAQDDLVEKEAWRIDVGMTFHRHEEDRNYFSFGLQTGLQPGWDAGIRGTFAKVGAANSMFPLRTGGGDLEIYVRHAIPNTPRLYVQGGLSVPNTPSQENIFFTYGAQFYLPNENQQFKLWVGGKGAARADSNVGGLSIGGEFTLGQNIDLYGDATVILWGNNTRDVNTGGAMRRAVYNLGVRFRPTMSGMSDASFFFGITNSLGTTTGASLASALGNQPALTLGITIRGRS